MEIYLIRHGECYPSSPEYYDEEKRTMNPPLTQIGVLQAERLAARLAPLHFNRIYCSDLDRAICTATILNQFIKTEMMPSPAFREIDMEFIYLQAWDDYPDIHQEWSLHQQDIPYPGGENGTDVWERCLPELNGILATDFKRVAIVCHGGTIRCIICGALGIPQQKRFSFGDPPENCAVSILRHDSSFNLHTFNDYSHIPTRLMATRY